MNVITRLGNSTPFYLRPWELFLFFSVGLPGSSKVIPTPTIWPRRVLGPGLLPVDCQRSGSDEGKNCPYPAMSEFFRENVISNWYIHHAHLHPLGDFWSWWMNICPISFLKGIHGESCFYRKKTQARHIVFQSGIPWWLANMGHLVVNWSTKRAMGRDDKLDPALHSYLP